MKTKIILLSSVVIMAATSCNDTATKVDTKTDTTANMGSANGDTTVKTTTTTTTTTTSIHPIANFEHRTFVSVKTGKKIKLKVDTVHHYYIDVNTNQQPDYYYFDPATHDTFDYRGRILNHALIYDNGNYNVDESKLTDNGSGSTDAGSNTNTSQDNMNSSSDNNNSGTSSGHTKIKQKEDMYKEKTDNSKMKVTDKKIKIKENQ